MNRITRTQLENLVNILNDLSGNPREPWFKLPNGHLQANVGTYLLNQNGIGWALECQCEGGGTRTVSSGGRVSARELYNQMRAIRAYVDGFDNN